jgi:hypothetical protein
MTGLGRERRWQVGVADQTKYLHDCPSHLDYTISVVPNNATTLAFRAFSNFVCGNVRANNSY